MGKIFNWSVITGESGELKKEVTQNGHWGKCVKGSTKAGPYPPRVERGNSSVGHFIMVQCLWQEEASTGLSRGSGRRTEISLLWWGCRALGNIATHQRWWCTCSIPVMTEPYFDGAGRNKESVWPRAAGAGDPQLLPRKVPITVVKSAKCYCWKSFCASTWEQRQSLYSGVTLLSN